MTGIMLKKQPILENWNRNKSTVRKLLINLQYLSLQRDRKIEDEDSLRIKECHRLHNLRICLRIRIKKFNERSNKKKRKKKRTCHRV